MITSKERATLIAIAGKLDCTMQIGLGGLSNESFVQIDAMLNKHEIAKIRVLNNCPNTAQEIALQASEATSSELVKVIGHVFILYRKSTKAKVKHILA